MYIQTIGLLVIRRKNLPIEKFLILILFFVCVCGILACEYGKQGHKT